MKLLLDAHTHTLASGHAYSTIQEMITAAKEQGLSLLAVTEHGPQMPGTCAEMYFRNLKVIPRRQQGVKLLFGVELNILDYEGAVDLPDDLLKELDFAIASLHLPCYQGGSTEENTNACIGAMKHGAAVIGHPDDSRIPVDYSRLVEAARNHNVLLELNNSSLKPTSYRLHAKENYREMLALCRELKVPILVNSDAHTWQHVGVFTEAVSLLEEVGFPEELVMNTSPEQFLQWLEQKRTRLQNK